MLSRLGGTCPYIKLQAFVTRVHTSPALVRHGFSFLIFLPMSRGIEIPVQGLFLGFVFNQTTMYNLIDRFETESVARWSKCKAGRHKSRTGSDRTASPSEINTDRLQPGNMDQLESKKNKN